MAYHRQNAAVSLTVDALLDPRLPPSPSLLELTGDICNFRQIDARDPCAGLFICREALIKIDTQQFLLPGSTSIVQN